MSRETTLICIGCNKHPGEIDEYIDIAKDEGIRENDYIREYEGTYNRQNGHFYCTSCYVKAEMPLGIAP